MTLLHKLMKENPYKIKLQNKALMNNARIGLPETFDERIVKASERLQSFGFNIIDNQLLQSNIDRYIEIVSSKKFTNHWTKKMIFEYVKNPTNLSLISGAEESIL